MSRLVLHSKANTAFIRFLKKLFAKMRRYKTIGDIIRDSNI